MEVILVKVWFHFVEGKIICPIFFSKFSYKSSYPKSLLGYLLDVSLLTAIFLNQKHYSVPIKINCAKYNETVPNNK